MKEPYGLKFYWVAADAVKGSVIIVQFENCDVLLIIKPSLLQYNGCNLEIEWKSAL